MTTQFTKDLKNFTPQFRHFANDSLRYILIGWGNKESKLCGQRIWAHISQNRTNTGHQAQLKDDTGMRFWSKQVHMGSSTDSSGHIRLVDILTPVLPIMSDMFPANSIRATTVLLKIMYTVLQNPKSAPYDISHIYREAVSDTKRSRSLGLIRTGIKRRLDDSRPSDTLWPNEEDEDDDLIIIEPHEFKKKACASMASSESQSSYLNGLRTTHTKPPIPQIQTTTSELYGTPVALPSDGISIPSQIPNPPPTSFKTLSAPRRSIGTGSRLEVYDERKRRIERVYKGIDKFIEAIKRQQEEIRKFGEEYEPISSFLDGLLQANDGALDTTLEAMEKVVTA